MAPVPRSKMCCNARYSPEASWACFQSAASSTVRSNRLYMVDMKWKYAIIPVLGWNSRKIKSTDTRQKKPLKVRKLHIVTFWFYVDQWTTPACTAPWVNGTYVVCHSHRHLTDRMTVFRSFADAPSKVNGEKYPWRSKDLEPIAFEFPPSSSSSLASPNLYRLKLNLWPLGVGGWRRLYPFKAFDADAIETWLWPWPGNTGQWRFCAFGVTALSPFVFFSTFLLFGNRGLRPNPINFQGFFVGRRNLWGDRFIQSCYFWNRPGTGLIIPWTSVGLLVAGDRLLTAFFWGFFSFAWIGSDWPERDAHHGIPFLVSDLSF